MSKGRHQVKPILTDWWQSEIGGLNKQYRRHLWRDPFKHDDRDTGRPSISTFGTFGVPIVGTCTLRHGQLTFGTLRHGHPACVTDPGGVPSRMTTGRSTAPPSV